MARRPRSLAAWLEHDLLALLNFCVLMIPIVLGAREVASRLAIDLSHERAPSAAAAPLPGEPAEMAEGNRESATEGPGREPLSSFPDPVVGYGP